MIGLQGRLNKVMSKTLTTMYIEQRKNPLTGDFEHSASPNAGTFL